MGIIKPYPGRQLKESPHIFNYRICSGRRIVEDAFGILCVRWQIFYKTLNHSSEITQLVQACVVLHKFLMSQSNSTLGYVIDDKTDASTSSIINGNWPLLIPV